MWRLIYSAFFMTVCCSAEAVTYQCRTRGETPVDINLTTFRFYDSGVRGAVELLSASSLRPVYPGEEGRDGPIFNVGNLEKILRERPAVISDVSVYSDSRFRGKATCIRL